MRWTIWAGCALAFAVVTGCSSAPTPNTPTMVTVSPTSSTPSPTPVIQIPTTAWPVPSAYPDAQRVHSASHLVSFSVPADWKQFDVSTFQDPEVRASLEPLAKQVGKSVDDYIHEISTATDMIVRSPEREGRTSTVSVRREQIQQSTVPTMDEASASLRAAKATVSKVTPLSTPVGAGYAVFFSRTDDAGAAWSGAILGLPASQGTTFLATVESDKPDEVEKIVAMASSSLTHD